MSKSQSSFAKRVSKSDANAPTSPISPLKDTTNNGDDSVTGTAETPSGPISFNITTDGSLHSSCKSGITSVMSATAEVPIETIFREVGSPQISCNSYWLVLAYRVLDAKHQYIFHSLFFCTSTKTPGLQRCFRTWIHATVQKDDLTAEPKKCNGFQ
jgi:hypothetical protein